MHKGIVEDIVKRYKAFNSKLKEGVAAKEFIPLPLVHANGYLQELGIAEEYSKEEEYVYKGFKLMFV